MKANAQVASSSATFPPSLAELSDGDLLAGTRRLVGASNQLLASLLAHLAEVEARGVHRTRACSSLYTYCVYELRLSEDAAFRRVSASRLVRRFPALFDAIASGELPDRRLDARTAPDGRKSRRSTGSRQAPHQA